MEQKPNPYKTTDKTNRFDDMGREVLNPTPVAPPVGFVKQPSLADQIRQQVLNLKHLSDMDPETEEEADDFEIDEDPAMPSRWENDMVPSIRESRARLRELEREEARLVAASSRPLAGAPSTPGVNEEPSEPPQPPPHSPTIAQTE